MGFQTRLRDIKRVSHITNVLFQHGLGYFIDEMHLKWHLTFKNKLKVHKHKLPKEPEKRLREAFEELGATFIKLGQLLSLRPDLIPNEYCEEFKKLHDEVKPFSFAEVEKQVQTELGQPISKLFKSFDKKPIGSASVAQVHKAVLKNGKKVVVKVQRPNIQEQFAADIDIMLHLVHKMHERIKISFDPEKVIKEFQEYTARELNFLYEARNITTFHHYFKKSKIKIPEVFMEFCTEEIVVMEYLDGIKMDDLSEKKKKPIGTKVAKNLLEATMKMIYDLGTFHADLHPGNIIIMKNGKIGLLDFGIVGTFTSDMKEDSLDFYTAIIKQDVNKIVEILLRIGAVSPSADLASFKRKTTEIINHWHGYTIAEDRATHMLHQLLDNAFAHGIELPVDMVLLGKSLVTVEATAHILDPKLNFVQASKPIMKKIMQKHLKSKLTIEDFMDKARDINEIVSALPTETLSLVQKMNKGGLRFDMSDRYDVRTVSLEIGRSANRLAFAILIVALLSGGTFAWQAGWEPKLLEFPVITSVSFLLTIILGISFLVSIFHDRKVRKVNQ